MIVIVSSVFGAFCNVKNVAINSPSFSILNSLNHDILNLLISSLLNCLINLFVAITVAKTLEEFILRFNNTGKSQQVSVFFAKDKLAKFLELEKRKDPHIFQVFSRDVFFAFQPLSC